MPIRGGREGIGGLRGGPCLESSLQAPGDDFGFLIFCSSESSKKADSLASAPLQIKSKKIIL